MLDEQSRMNTTDDCCGRSPNSVTVVAAKPSVPVVFGYSGDPVVAGIAQSLSRPGGDATGMSFMSI